MSNDAGSIDHKAADQSNDQATQSLGAYQGDMADFMSNVNSTLSAGNPYESKGYKTNQNLETSAALNSENDAADQRLEQTSARTGTNTAALANEEASNARAGARDVTAYNASRDTANEDKWLQQKNELTKDQLAGANSEAGVYATGKGAQSKDLESMTQADDAESQMWASLGSAGLTAAGTAGAAFCPAEGSPYLMADGTEKPVELLHVGDQLAGIDGEPQTIEEIQYADAPVLLVRTEDGHEASNSRTHAYALPAGGFVVAVHSLGKTILTETGRSKVVSVTPNGRARVFNVITDGSHTYRASGVWALGVGEAERHVSMDTWEGIGERLSLTT